MKESEIVKAYKKYRKNKKDADQGSGSEIDPDDYSLPDDYSYNSVDSFHDDLFEFDADLQKARQRKADIEVELSVVQQQKKSERETPSSIKAVVTPWKK